MNTLERYADLTRRDVQGFQTDVESLAAIERNGESVDESEIFREAVRVKVYAMLSFFRLLERIDILHRRSLATGKREWSVELDDEIRVQLKNGTDTASVLLNVAENLGVRGDPVEDATLQDGISGLRHFRDAAAAACIADDEFLADGLVELRDQAIEEHRRGETEEMFA